MKKIIAILLISLTFAPIAFADDNVYVFTEEQLREYTEEIVEDAYFTKDLEIANLMKTHDLIVLDKDFMIDTQELTIEGDAIKILGLEVKNKAQSTFIKWTPVIIVGSIAAGIVGGILIGRNL